MNKLLLASVCVLCIASVNAQFGGGGGRVQKNVGANAQSEVGLDALKQQKLRAKEQRRKNRAERLRARKARKERVEARKMAKGQEYFDNQNFINAGVKGHHKQLDSTDIALSDKQAIDAISDFQINGAEKTGHGSRVYMDENIGAADYADGALMAEGLEESNDGMFIDGEDNTAVKAFGGEMFGSESQGFFGSVFGRKKR